MDEKTFNTIKKLAEGYEYEEVQTFIEETSHGSKKKMVRIKKHHPPDLNAIKYLEQLTKKSNLENLESEVRKLMGENIHGNQNTTN